MQKLSNALKDRFRITNKTIMFKMAAYYKLIIRRKGSRETMINQEKG